MYSFYTKYNTLNNSQFGFRESHSPTTTLSEFVEGVLSTFDNGDAICAVLLYLSKAFDCLEKFKVKVKFK